MEMLKVVCDTKHDTTAQKQPTRMECIWRGCARRKNRERRFGNLGIRVAKPIRVENKIFNQINLGRSHARSVRSIATCYALRAQTALPTGLSILFVKSGTY